MRRRTQQPIPLHEALANEPHFSIFEIPEAAMDKPRRPGRRAAGNVIGIYDDHRNIRKSEFTGERRPVDARPEDEHGGRCRGRVGRFMPVRHAVYP